MIDIRLFDNDHFTVFLFAEDDHIQNVSKRHTCGYCKFWHVSSYHINIIKQLKEAGLLREDYPIMCCECYARLIGRLPLGKEIDRSWLM